MRRNKIIRGVTVSMSVDFFTNLIPELNKQGFEIISVSSDGPELKRVHEAGGRPIVVEMARRISVARDLKSLWKMIRIFRREKPLMVHSMTPKAGMMCMLAGWLTRVPVRVHTFTGLVFPTATGIKRRILMATDWLTCACATHVIPEGEGVRNDLLDNRITRKPIRVLGYGNCRGIDLKKFNPDNDDVKKDAKRLIKDGVFTFVFVGRLVGDKGINELVEAFERLNIEMSDTRLLLVGPEEPDLDPLKPSTLEKIQSIEAIEAVGNQKDVRPWLLAADAFVLPSYREGFPNVVIEAGAMGLPSIVTDVNGSREIVKEGENGVIVPPRDVNALYNAMKEFVERPEWVRAMGEKSRPLIARRFEQSFVSACLLDFYREILPD